MGLGQYLVRELDFEEGVDTLGRWMAHHLAQLMYEAENGSTAAKRLKAQRDAVKTILKIWEHRTSLPGNTYPLAPYKDILKVLDRLRPDHTQGWYIWRQGEAKREQLAADLFSQLSRIVIALVLMNAPTDAMIVESGDAAVEALSDTERGAFIALQQWYEFIVPASGNSEQTRKHKEDGDPAKIDLNEIATELIHEIRSTLTDLEKELQEANQNP